ncbi:flagellar hook-length control protein FliK [Arthrobacter sp. 3Tela_A]|uniref:flagellar hook-length control protein FliK n=1 Tax=Arthrobacter sp. 3Tela_A TaxID=3093743 RepID=UPI003BB49798
MNLSVTVAVPAPAIPSQAGPGAGAAAGVGTGAGSGSAGAFQSLLEALAVLPGNRQVPGTPAAVLPGDGPEDPAAETGQTDPETAGSALLPDGTGTAPAGFSYGAGTAAAEAPQVPAPDAIGTDSAAELHPGSGMAAAGTAVSTVLPAAAAVAAGASAAAAPGVPAAPHPTRTVAAPVPVPPTGTPAAADPARPATPAPPFPPAALRETGQVLRPSAFPLPAASTEAAGHPEWLTGTAASSQVPGVVPAVPPAAQAAGTAAAAPPLPAAAPQLHTQLAKPVFSLLAAGDGEHVMTLKVTPESLGTVTVRAVIGADGVRLELFAADAGREAVRAVLPDLRRELAGSGFNASLDLGSGSRPNGETGQDQHRAPGRGEVPELPAAAVRPQDPAPSHPIPDGASALDILA